MKRAHLLFSIAAAASLAAPALAGTLSEATVTRGAAGGLTVTWRDADPVDVFVADRPDAAVGDAKRVSDDDRDGRFVLDAAGTARRYFLLRDERTKAVVTVAERLLPLEQGSNFRDLGGYPAADGKHVRWGMIFRSGATPLLTPADVQQVRALGLRQLVDLRSSEERALAPTRIDGVPYSAVGYSMAALLPGAGGTRQITNGSNLYRNFPTLLAPQLKLLFAELVAGQAPIAYNCSAGQDRTGFATAMILAALGTPRAAILQDYDLSTAYRRPEFEMPRIDPAAHPGDPAAALFAQAQRSPEAAKPRPLKEADGTPFLTAALDEIDKRWGSSDAYLEREIGLTPVQRAQLRRTYLN